jgi:S-formylglutathione hydrolase
VEHKSSSTKTLMKFSIYVPQSRLTHLPMLTFLSGLTCNEQNFTTKAGAYKKASELGLIILVPDTSPRGEDVADDKEYDLGQGASFYVDALQAPWKENFQMYSYITKELQELVHRHFPVDPKRRGIFGHSMGGHGALMIGLKNPDIFRSISAFSPITNPCQVPWGKKAFQAYLGPKKESWAEYDSTVLVKKLGGPRRGTILIDQGARDEFLQRELRPESFNEACKSVGQRLELRMHDGFDHSYFFISSFVDDHLEFHSQALKGS